MSDESWREALHADLTAGRRRKRELQPYDTREWKRRRDALKGDAFCILCLRFGVHTPAAIADHVVPVTSGDDFAGQLQALCTACHRVKKLVEGQWRRGALLTSELDFRISREAARLRAPVGADGFAIRPRK